MIASASPPAAFVQGDQTKSVVISQITEEINREKKKALAYVPVICMH